MDCDRLDNLFWPHLFDSKVARIDPKSISIQRVFDRRNIHASFSISLHTQNHSYKMNMFEVCLFHSFCSIW